MVAARQLEPASAQLHRSLSRPAVTQPAGDAEHSHASIGPSCSVTELPADVLSMINAVRTAGHACGGERFGAAAALAWDDRLFRAASGHAADMAHRDYVDHVTPEGVGAVQRMEAAGYDWSRAAENIAAGNRSVDAVMTAWLKSESHCRNILNPSFSDVAVACVRAVPSSYGTYWTMKLGKR